MRKRKFLVLALFLFTFIVVGAIYKRPVTLAQLCSEIELNLCKNITAYYSLGKTAVGEKVDFSSENEEFNLLIELIQQQKFRKSFKNFFPSGTKIHPLNNGDFKWEIMLKFNDPIPMKDGSTASGVLIHLNNFYGDLTIDNMVSRQSIRCNTKNQQQWAREILRIIIGE